MDQFPGVAIIEVEEIRAAIKDRDDPEVTVIIRNLAAYTALDDLQQIFSAHALHNYYDLLCLYSADCKRSRNRKPYAVVNLRGRNEAIAFVQTLQFRRTGGPDALSGAYVKLAPMQGYRRTMETFMPILQKPAVRCAIWDRRGNGEGIAGFPGMDSLRLQGPVSIERFCL